MYECRDCGWEGETPDLDIDDERSCPDCGSDVREVRTYTAEDQDRIRRQAAELIRQHRRRQP
jgi:rubredoxin